MPKTTDFPGCWFSLIRDGRDIRFRDSSNNIHNLWFERSTTDQEAVDVWVVNKGSGVGVSH